MDRPNGDGWAHLVSDIDGEKGRTELKDFGKLLGLARLIHRNNTYAEHYDIRGWEIEKAEKAGALTVSRRELGYILKDKKSSRSGISRSV
jgi:hypothetical protein